MKNKPKILLRQVQVLDSVNKTNQITDVLIAVDRAEIIENYLPDDLSEDTNILNAEGLILGSGLIDLYSHSSQPGYEERETIESLTAAAAAGGFTRLAILPDTMPPVDSIAVLKSLQELAKKKLDCLEVDRSAPQLNFWGALSTGISGQKMSEIAQLASVGVIGFSDGYPIENFGFLRQLLEYLKPFNKPVALFNVNRDLKGNGIVREGATAIRCGLPGDPVVSEAVAIAAVLELADAIGIPIHLMRISTARSVELIASAKAKGLPITASTTWMHLLLSNDLINNSYDPNLHLNPSLGDLRDREALIAGVKQGIIDAIAVDHTPYTYEEKTLPFAAAPPGAIGLELALPLLWQELVVKKKLTALELWRAFTVGPLLCLHQQPKEPFNQANPELTLFDPKMEWKVVKNNLQSLSTNTPWLGKTITGRVVRTWNFPN